MRALLDDIDAFRVSVLLLYRREENGEIVIIKSRYDLSARDIGTAFNFRTPTHAVLALNQPFLPAPTSSA